MSDLEERADALDTPVAEDKVPAGDAASTSPPWGEDFDPERAWQTIQTQRAAEADYKRQLSEAREQAQYWEQFTQDPDSVIRALGYEIEDDEADPELAGLQEDPSVQLQARLDQIEQRQQQADLAEARAELEQHIDQLATQHDLTLTKRQRQALSNEAWNNGDATRDFTESLVKEWADDAAAYRDEIVKEYRGSKRAPRAAPSGQSGSKKLDLSNEQDRQNFMAELMQAEGE